MLQSTHFFTLYIIFYANICILKLKKSKLLLVFLNISEVSMFLILQEISCGAQKQHLLTPDKALMTA